MTNKYRDATHLCMEKNVFIYNGFRVGDQVQLKTSPRPYLITEILTDYMKPAKFVLDDGLSFITVTEYEIKKEKK